jgi:hypothetical protein
MDFQRPWDRDTRPGVSEYDANLWAIASKRKTSSAGVPGSQAFLSGSKDSKGSIGGIYPRIPPFEFTAYAEFSNYS